ncbi:MAG: hypothetical protein IJ109_07650 [Firmicutes bacterium]|nr:hypothetical protein [Bacillota bacterium]
MLFDIIPDNFFGPLAAPGKTVYWECIRRLFAITSRQLSFGVERDVLVDELEYYFEQNLAADLPRDAWEEQDRNRSGAGMALSPRDKANHMLRRLERYGWISIEVDYSYVQRVSFRDHAIRVIRTLTQIEHEEKTEYQGYIYTIYNLARAKDHPGLALTQIVENTELLITGLKSLNANIKQYIDDLTKHRTVAQILDALLNDYYTNVVDKAYHRLMTSDNVSKFRPEIIQRLEESSRSSRYMNGAARELAQIREIPEEQARSLALDMLHDVIEAFRQMDEILDEINRKNARYQRAAVGRARFLLTSSDDVRGQLKDIICALNDAFQSEGYTDHNMIYELEETDRLIRLFSIQYLDTDSLHAPRTEKKAFQPQEIAARSVDEKSRQQRLRQIAEKLERVLSAEKIDAYVQTILDGRQQIMASQLPLEEDDTFIRLIYVRLYGQRKNMSYEIIPGKHVRKDGFRFRDFEIRRKEKQD